MKFYEAMIDPELDTKGRWVEFVPGMRFRVARLDNKRARDYHRQRVQEAQDRAGKAKVAPEVIDAIALDTFAHCVLTDWGGPLLVDDAGAPIPFSPEQALEYLRDERCRDLKAFLEAASMQAASYSAAARKDAEGNLRSA